MHANWKNCNQPGFLWTAAVSFAILLAVAGCRDAGSAEAGAADDSGSTDRPVADPGSRPDESPDASAYSVRQLFDGRTMNQWEIIGFGTGREIVVADGCIVAEAGYPLAGIRFTGDELPVTDYSLCLDARKIDGTDFFCCITFPAGQETCSFVMGGWGGPVTGISCVDEADASDNQTRSVKKYEPGKWYPVRIDVTDGRIVCHVDGETVVDLPRDGIRLSVRGDIDKTRPLGICAFETESSWRNIQLIQPAYPPEFELPAGQ